MIQYLRLFILSAVISLFIMGASAQESGSSSRKIPKWVSEAGYWVVESNIHTPLNHTIWFYNNDHILVYKEAVNGMRLNPARKMVKMKLKKVLEASVITWQEKKVTQENKDFVTAILK
jgi:hypothetical protein